MPTNEHRDSPEYRHSLPQLHSDFFLTEGGIETTLIFHEGFELPEFAAFDLLRYENGRQALLRYYRSYTGVAQRHGVGVILETPTWRANSDWGRAIGYDRQALAHVNAQSVDMLQDIRAEVKSVPVVISGCIGPADDGYSPGHMMSAMEAQAYHSEQIQMFAALPTDMVTAITMTYTEEAIGIVRAAAAESIPVVISFTVETDGHLPSGQSLASAIAHVDASTNSATAYYMINCAHPVHFAHVLDGESAWAKRIRGLRANASRMSHAELDQAQELDTGDPEELAVFYHDLRAGNLPNLVVMGGCCGTDHTHMESICQAYLPKPVAHDLSTY